MLALAKLQKLSLVASFVTLTCPSLLTINRHGRQSENNYCACLSLVADIEICKRWCTRLLFHVSFGLLLTLSCWVRSVVRA